MATLFSHLFRDGSHPALWNLELELAAIVNYFDEAEWNLELELAAIAKKEASADAEEDMMVADLVIDGVLPEEAVERLKKCREDPRPHCATSPSIPAQTSCARPPICADLERRSVP
jgi:hypothetical protein